MAVTGTNGKTSTKEMLAAVLGTRYRTHATRANLNNLVGVPMTILEAPDDTEALVVEAGANLPGEIARYREIIEPSLTIVTNAVAGHLEGFGSLAGVVEEKLALTDGVPLAIVGTDPAELAAGARRRARHGADGRTARRRPRSRSRRARSGRAARAHRSARPPSPWPSGVSIRRTTRRASGPSSKQLGLDRAAAAAALEGFGLPAGRGELLEQGGLTILNDCYNANPQSFRAAIATARALRGDRRLVFIAGTMRELGAESAALHREIAAALVALQPDLLAVVGDFVPAVAPYAEQLGDRLVTAEDPIVLGPLRGGASRGRGSGGAQGIPRGGPRTYTPRAHRWTEEVNPQGLCHLRSRRRSDVEPADHLGGRLIHQVGGPQPVEAVEQLLYAQLSLAGPADALDDAATMHDQDPLA